MRRIFISFFLSILLLKYASSEDEILCGQITDKGGKQCSEFKTSDNDHYCTDNTDQEATTPCKEADACNKLAPAEGSCDAHPKHNDNDKYVCKVSTKDETKCIELTKCEGETLETYNYDNCQKLYAGEDKICVVNNGKTACKIATECDDIQEGATVDICSGFKTETSKCIVEKVNDKDKCTSKPICGKAEYVAGCPNFVTEDDNTICVDTKAACEPKTPCLKASTDCNGLPTSDGKKICKKDEKENNCVEDDPTENGDTNGGEETKPAGGEETKPAGGEETKPAGGEETKPTGEADTKPTGEADTKPTGEADTKPTGEADTKPTGEADTKPTGESGPTEGTETDLNKDNKGMLLNMNLYTLLIYFLF